MTSVRLVAVTPVTRSSLHGSTWDFAYVELWSLARECMFKQVSKSRNDVCPSGGRHAGNSVISAWIDVGLCLC